ncbi:hypothetical protein D1872_197550 [compost metagenome]
MLHIELHILLRFNDGNICEVSENIPRVRDDQRAPRRVGIMHHFQQGDHPLEDDFRIRVFG